MKVWQVEPSSQSFPSNAPTGASTPKPSSPRSVRDAGSAQAAQGNAELVQRLSAALQLLEKQQLDHREDTEQIQRLQSHCAQLSARNKHMRQLMEGTVVEGSVVEGALACERQETEDQVHSPAVVSRANAYLSARRRREGLGTLADVKQLEMRCQGLCDDCMPFNIGSPMP